jgi:hypothetical protein
MDEELRGILIDRIDKACDRLAKRGSFALDDAATKIIEEFIDEDNRRWKQIRDDFAMQGVLKYVNRLIRKAAVTDPEQRTLPGLESMPLFINSGGAAILAEQLDYQRYQTELTRLDRRIKSYDAKRRKPENLEADKKQLAEMKTFDPRFAKYSKKNPELTLVEAKRMEAGESPSGRKRGR